MLRSLRSPAALVAVALCLTINVLPARAASFDCGEAKEADEKAICANPKLNDRDVELATRYEMLASLLAMGSRGDLQDRQHAWLERRKTCGSDTACLAKSYDERLAELKKGFDAVVSRGPF